MQTLKKQGGFIQLVGLALSAASLVAGNKARKAQNSARAAQQQSNRIRNFQAQRQFLRNAQIEIASAIANPIARGADVSSSAAQANLSSIQAQTRTAERDFQEQNRLGELASSQLNKAANAQFASSVFSTVGQFASSAAGSNLLDKVV